MDREEQIGRLEFALDALNEFRQGLTTDPHAVKSIAEQAFQKLRPVWEELENRRNA